MKINLKRKIGFAIIAMTVPVAVIIGWLAYQDLFMTRVSSGHYFIEEELDLANNNIIDMGVVDFDGDGNLDVFSVNHQSAQSLLKGDGKGGFVEVISDLGLEAPVQFPGAAISALMPTMNRPGLYIFWQNYGLVFEWVPGGGISTPSGRITLESKIAISDSKGFDHRVVEEGGAHLLPQSIIEFSAKSRGKMVIEAELLAIPVEISLSSDSDPNSVYIGRQALNPKASTFELFLNDRHGMAWADHDGDGQLDVFISRGGLRGQMARSKTEFSDELYRQQGSKFENSIHQSGIQKENCPGYNAQWVDIESDDDLDLYVTCHHSHNNKLYMNDGSGKFQNVAEQLGVGFADSLTDTPFLWIDVNNDGLQDLVVVDTDGVHFFENKKEGFEHAAVFPASGVAKLAANDYDNDGDIDILIASYSGDSGLLINDSADFAFVSSESVGLPDHILTAGWVDFDNDGTTELHVIPGGLFEQTADLTFASIDLLAHEFPRSVGRARLSWSDLDNDGDLDLLMAINYEHPVWKIALHRLLNALTDRPSSRLPRIWQWQVRAFYNQADKGPSPNNWVQFELVGTKSNLQAIGANVVLDTPESSRAAFVGQFENSLLSQGHYRLYFGLGQSDNPSKLLVTWPDGGTSRHPVESVNKLVRIARPQSVD